MQSAFDALMELSGSCLMWESMAGLQSGEGRVIIDSVVWAQYINVTDRHTTTQTATQPRRDRAANKAVEIIYNV